MIIKNHGAKLLFAAIFVAFFLVALFTSLPAGRVSAFSFTLSSEGDKQVTQGSSVTNLIAAMVTSTSGGMQNTGFSITGLPSNSTYSFSPTSCLPSCSTSLTINTTTATPQGFYYIKVYAMASARGSVVQRTTFTLTVTSSSIAVATSLSTQASTKFAIGDRVYVSSGPLNVRKQPRTNSAKLGTQPTGAQGAVVGGPIFRSNYWWWKINYDTGADGWSIENFLEKVSPIPTPTPTPTPAPTITDFDFFLANGGLKSTNQGSFVTNFVTATLVSGTSQSVSFSTSGLPAGATATFSPTSCSPACSSTF